MKFVLVSSLLLTFVIGVTARAETQNRETQKIRIEKQKKFAKSKLTVRFVSLLEDSRCPEGVDCVWAGNARIKIEVWNRRTKNTYELNTNLGAKGANFEGYAIELIALTPIPKENIRIDRNSYVAEFAVSKLIR